MACAQLIHAAGESSDGKLKPGTYAVALGVETENELRALADELDAKGVPVHRVEESTGKYAGQLMALGIKPGPKSVRGKHLSNLPLLRMVDFTEYYDVQQSHWAETKTLRREIRELKHQRQPWWSRLQQWWRATA